MYASSYRITKILVRMLDIVPSYLSTSCEQCIHHFNCFLLMHICISIVFWSLQVLNPRNTMRTPTISGVRVVLLEFKPYNRNAYMHEEEIIRCIVGRKFLNRCTPFSGVSHWIRFRVCFSVFSRFVQICFVSLFLSCFFYIKGRILTKD